MRGATESVPQDGSGRDSAPAVTIGRLPYRMQLAGGWIDQPFMSSRNPEPPGSMVVVSLEPTVRFMDRCGMATGTRAVAGALWGDTLPARGHDQLIRELYAAENEGRAQPSGSQDMAGLVIPGISRLDYDADFDGGWFPRHVESTTDPAAVEWLERVIHFVPVAPRPLGYDPLVDKRIDPVWVQHLSRSGRNCYDAIVGRDLAALGQSFRDCSEAWDALLPGVFEHPTIALDLRGLLATYQSKYPGAMYSGCGGGYLIVASDEAVPGSFGIRVRVR